MARNTANTQNAKKKEIFGIIGIESGRQTELTL